MREFPIVFSTSGYLLFLLCCILVHLFLQTSAIFSGGIISHTFELEAKSKGVFAGEPAVIKFRVPTKSALQVNICWNCCLFFILFLVSNLFLIVVVFFPIRRHIQLPYCLWTFFLIDLLRRSLNGYVSLYFNLTVT